MAANKFATMLHRNTHKIIVILAYAVLEWILICLLLMNSLFSFLVSKFAIYFGLKPPCLWCSRVDHMLEPEKRRSSYRDLVCEAHATEISKLCYCSNHHKLADPHYLCKDCLFAGPKHDDPAIEISRRIAFFTWVSESRIGNGEGDSKCSCCDESLSSKLYPSLLLFKPSWKGELAAEAMDDDNNECEFSVTSKSDCSTDHCSNNQEIERTKQEEEEGDEHQILSDVDGLSSKPEAEEDSSRSGSDFQRCTRNGNGNGEDESFGIMNLIVTSSSCSDIDRLIPVALIDSSTMESRISNPIGKEEQPLQKHNHHQNRNSDSEPRIDEFSETEAGSDVVSQVAEKIKSELVNSSILVAEPGIQDLEAGTRQLLAITDGNVEAEAMKELEAEGQEDDDCHFSGVEAKSENLAGMPNQKRETGAEESWDGSVISEMEGADGALTIDKLQAALRAERKALSALYAELEEERSAAAIAANQSMAMITRLQEEKAAMKMEALQYQRMMEEQSEYDQEALQLLNELMTKREKEKQDLEKELELYRRKVVGCEAKEKLTRRKEGSLSSRNSSACGNAEEVDQLSIYLNCETRNEDGSFYEHQEGSNISSPADAELSFEEMGLDSVKHLSALDESLAEFEEERLSILEELKVLEAKLFAMAADEQHSFEDVKEYSSENGDSNGLFWNSDGEPCPESNTMHLKAKKLLPLFDETESLNHEQQTESDPSCRIQNSLSKLQPESKKLAVEEEVYHVYDRLQALETDRDFLKHCISSIKKGDKGIDLLQEILQHLRDLRTVEDRARNICDSPLA
ncbi:myosin-binding protein 3 [Diospyros lotus]|uniref:myosin-binding protein 3 n=1 Tax=Diospyros lotus TaxID=55363 RepID=UPI00224D7A28|nr:myosin-binding protein 3 [Diospyros lotus]